MASREHPAACCVKQDAGLGGHFLIEKEAANVAQRLSYHSERVWVGVMKNKDSKIAIVKLWISKWSSKYMGIF